MTMRAFSVGCAVLGLCAVFCCADAVQGGRRRPPPPPPKPPQLVPVTLDGIIESATPDEIVMVVNAPSKDKKKKPDKNAPRGKWIVAFQTTTKLTVTGEAKPDYLRTGQMVQFTGSVEGKEVKDEVKELHVISIHAGSHSSPASKPAAKLADAAAPAPEGAPDKISGRLDKFLEKDNKWSVHVGGKSVLFRLADSVKIKVTLSNGKRIRAGDTVTVQGKMVKGKQGSCVADDVKVTLAAPLTGPKKTKPAKLDSTLAHTDKEEADKEETDSDDARPAAP